MPIVNRKLLTPEQALAQDRCPECGISFKDHDAAAHLKAHWQTEPNVNRGGAEAARRRALYRDYLKSHPGRSIATAAEV